MNLIEAIKSGKLFRRAGDADWLRYDQKGERVFTPHGTNCAFWCRDILAEDWKIQEPTVTITRAQLLEKMHSTMGSLWGRRDYELFDRLCVALGFPEERG